MQLVSTASRQLFNRPADEHFASMADIMANAESARDRSYESVVDINSASVFFTNDNGKLAMSLPDNTVVYPQNHALTQLGTLCNLNVRAMETMEARDSMDLVVRNLNALVKQPGVADFFRKLYIERDATDPEIRVLRSLNGLDYTRLHDATILRAIHEQLLPSGMIPALPTINTNANRENIFGNNKPCLFRGDRDSYCFFMEDGDVDDDLGGLRTGLMFSNSEVGTASFSWTEIYFRDICANFLIWGAQSMTRKRVIHRGNIAPKWHEFQRDIVRLYEAALAKKGEDFARFQRAAQTAFFGDGSPTEANKQGAAKILQSVKKLKISKKRSENIVKAALLPQNGGDLSVWSIANGITWDAKDTVNVSSMVDASKAATLVLAGVK